MSVNYSAFAWATITNNAGTGTAISLGTGEGANFPNGAQKTRCRIYLVSNPRINEEGLITFRSSDSLTVTRATDGRSALSLTNSGYAIDVIEALGDWDGPPTYDAGDYGSSSGGWDVSGATYYKYLYHVRGKEVALNFSTLGGTVTGTPNNLRLKLPLGLVAAKDVSAQWWAMQGGVHLPALAWVQLSLSTTQIYIYNGVPGLGGSSNWAAGSMGVGGEITIPLL